MPRNWADEQFVKLYVRKDPEWYDLDFKSRGLFNQLLEVVDRSGMLKLGRLGRRGVALAVRGPWEEVEPLLDELLDDGCVVITEDEEYLILPNFVEAQEARQSPAARQKKRRERVKAAVDTEKPSVVYFIASGAMVKIGSTTNLEKRLSSLSSSMPKKPELLACVRGGKRTERNIHKRFAHLRQHGEWFTKCDELMLFIDAMQKQNDANDRHAHGGLRDGSHDAPQQKGQENDANDRHALFLSGEHARSGVTKMSRESGICSEEIQQHELFVYERPSRRDQSRSDPSVCLPSQNDTSEHTHSDRFAWKPEPETRPNETVGVPRVWVPSDEHREKAESLGLDIDVELERWRLHPSNCKRHFKGKDDLHDRFMFWLVESTRFGGRQSRPPTEPEMANAPPLVRLEAPSEAEVKESRSVGSEALTAFLRGTTTGNDET